jgi:Family of unknown function (DUF6226)
MPEYSRPLVTARQFRDESGAVIRYGTRWDGSPPENSYSHVSNPERFAPLQTIADALIEHLRAAYLVDVAALGKSSTLVDPSTTTKLIAVTPRQADAAPLVFRFTNFPGVEIQAGIHYREAFPFCGCDACDETWGDAADKMEQLVFAVSDGRFSERIGFPDRAVGTATVEHRIEGAGHEVRSGIEHGVQPDSALREDAARLDRLPAGRWQPWASWTR